MNVNQPVARTAFYCTLLRADDASSSRPVCGDVYASQFVDDGIRRDLASLLRFSKPAASNVARHRIIDDIVRGRLSREAGCRVLLIGAGFDTRAFRLAGGRWFELDDPQLMAFKESRLPAAEAPNPLTRVPVTFASDPPVEYLRPFAGDDDALVILEGVSTYLTDAQLEAFARAVLDVLPHATLVCDLMSPAFARRFGGGLIRELAQMGAAFAERTDHPRRAIERAGFIATDTVSIVDRARQAGTTSVPTWLLNTLLRELRDGYAVWSFRQGGS